MSTIYMISYLNFDEGDSGLTYNLIERFMRVSKMHCNIGNQEKAFIQKAILDSILLLFKVGVISPGTCFLLDILRV